MKMSVSLYVVYVL